MLDGQLVETLWHAWLGIESRQEGTMAHLEGPALLLLGEQRFRVTYRREGLKGESRGGSHTLGVHGIFMS